MCKITYQTLTKYTILGGSYFQVSQIQESEIAVAYGHHMKASLNCFSIQWPTYSQSKIIDGH